MFSNVLLIIMSRARKFHCFFSNFVRLGRRTKQRSVVACIRIFMGNNFAKKNNDCSNMKSSFSLFVRLFAEVVEETIVFNKCIYNMVRLSPFY